MQDKSKKADSTTGSENLTATEVEAELIVNDEVPAETDAESETEGEDTREVAFPEVDHSKDPLNTTGAIELGKELQRTDVAKLDKFTSVEQIKAFASELGIKGSASQVLQAIVRGKELGVPSLIAYDNIYYVGGRATYSWQMLAAIINRAGVEFETIYDNWFLQEDGSVQQVKDENSIDRIVEIHFYRRSKLFPEKILTEKVRYTWLQATEAGLTAKSTWKAYGTSSLLWVRCFTNGAKRTGGQAMMGIVEFTEMADENKVDYVLNEQDQFVPR